MCTDQKDAQGTSPLRDVHERVGDRRPPLAGRVLVELVQDDRGEREASLALFLAMHLGHQSPDHEPLGGIVQTVDVHHRDRFLHAIDATTFAGAHQPTDAWDRAVEASEECCDRSTRHPSGPVAGIEVVVVFELGADRFDQISERLDDLVVRRRGDGPVGLKQRILQHDTSGPSGDLACPTL